MVLAMASGGTSTATAEDFIPTCPVETAYIYQETPQLNMYWKLSKGDVSKTYNDMGKEKFLEETKRMGLEYDLKACPPVNGHLNSPYGIYLDLPMGYFDDEANYMNEQEFQEHKKKMKQKIGGTAKR